MSYVMQGARRMGQGIAFGAVEPTDGWHVYGYWSLTRQGEVYTGKSAYPDPRPIGPAKIVDPTVAQWVAQQCADGKLVYRGAPYVGADGKKRVDLYADTSPLYQGFTSGGKNSTILQPQACPGQSKPPAQPPAPPQPELTEDETLFIQACFMSVDAGGKPVKLDRVIEVLGMKGNVVRFDEAKNDCVLEISEGKSKHLIFGAMALVAAAGGFYLYKRAR